MYFLVGIFQLNFIIPSFFIKLGLEGCADMNYLMKEFFEISKSDQFEKLDMMISTNEGYYIHDLETSSDTWFDTSFWS